MVTQLITTLLKKRRTIAEEIHIPSDAQIRGLEEGLLEYYRL
ncbi:MAG: hypothetical protein WD577_06235 [Bacteroidales bacterium]